jgi:hypothetical protein
LAVAAYIDAEFGSRSADKSLFKLPLVERLYMLPPFHKESTTLVLVLTSSMGKEGAGRFSLLSTLYKAHAVLCLFSRAAAAEEMENEI